MSTEPNMPQFRRHPATKLLIAELKETTFELPKNTDDKFESHYFLTPTGETISKVVVVGVAVEKEDVGKDQPFWRLRVVDATGGIAVYAGQYQAESAQTIAQLEIPSFVAVVGKPSIYEPENGSMIISIRPDNIVVVGAEERNSFFLDATEQLASRLKAPQTDQIKEAYPSWAGNKALAEIAASALKDILEPAPVKEVEQTAQPSPKPIEVPKPEPEPAPAQRSQPPTPTEETFPPLSMPGKKAKKTEKAPEKPKEVQATTEKSAAQSQSQFKNISETILEIVSKHKKGCTYTKLKEELKAIGIGGMTDIDGAMRQLMKEGKMYEPKLGTFQAS